MVRIAYSFQLDLAVIDHENKKGGSHMPNKHERMRNSDPANSLYQTSAHTDIIEVHG